MRGMVRFGLFIVGMLLLLVTVACSEQPTLTHRLDWPVPDFTYTDQNNQPFTRSQLEGKVWLADFVFTTCNTVCPPMTTNMAYLQKELAEAGLPVTIVSFSVNPTVDTPEILLQYGKDYGVDLNHWYFLTGYQDDEITQFAEEVFRTVVVLDPNSDQVIHGTHFYLIDKMGKIVKYYDGINPPYEEIIQDIKIILTE